MKDTLGIIVNIVVIFGVIGGIIAWWIGKFLSDKTDDISSSVKIGALTEKVKELEQDLNELKREFYHYKDTYR